jgi:hypothetical protein
VPRYIVERQFDRISDEDMLEASVRADEVRREEFPDLVWEHSHVCVDSDGGIMSFCVYSAPNEEEIRRHGAAFGGHVIGRVWEIVEDLTPDGLRQKLAGAGR